MDGERERKKKMEGEKLLVFFMSVENFPLFIFHFTFVFYLSPFLSFPSFLLVILTLYFVYFFIFFWLIFFRFHPPPPYYKINFNEVTCAYDIEFSPLAAHIDFENLTVELIRTKSKTTIPVLCLKYPGAKMTLIYSHGNATDCGAMFIMYAMLALTLKVNVVGYDYTGYGSSYDSGIRPTEKQTYRGEETLCMI